jgi:hypothetical protein
MMNMAVNFGSLLFPKLVAVQIAPISEDWDSILLLVAGPCLPGWSGSDDAFTCINGTVAVFAIPGWTYTAGEPVVCIRIDMSALATLLKPAKNSTERYLLETKARVTFE